MADGFVSRKWNIEDHAHISHIRECSDAARRNLRLGRWVQKLSPGQKLLLADLHNVFNAAIILLLHQIVFVNLRTNDVSDITFAKEVFEREAALGDKYGKDCAEILQDLSSLVEKLREIRFEGLPETTIPTRAVSAIPGEGIVSSLSAQGMGLISSSRMQNPAPTVAMPLRTADGSAIYQELMTWLDIDDMPAYNNYLV